MFVGVRMKPPATQNSISHKDNEWTTGLFDIHHDPGFCCLATVCPCAAYGLNYSMMIGDESSTSCVLPCVCFGVLEAGSVFLAVAHVMNCSKSGNPNDVDATTCCPLLQQQTALDNYITEQKDSSVCSLACEVCVCAPCAQTRLRNEFIVRKQRKRDLAFKPLPCSCCCTDWGWAGCVKQS